MMTAQARESFTPHFSLTHPLRSYPVNSPRAKARLIVLALLADGQLNKSEFNSLDRRRVYATLGLSREDFVAVLFDFCSDAAHLPNAAGNYQLTPGILDSLFAEVDSPAAKKALMRHIFEIICSDGKLAEGEERLFWNAVDAWNLRIPDLPTEEGVGKVLRPPPEKFYG